MASDREIQLGFNLIVFKNSQNESGRGTIIKVSKNEILFEVYNPYSLIQLSERLQQIIVAKDHITVYEGSGFVTNIVNAGIFNIVSVELSSPWINFHLLQPGDIFRKEITQFIDEWHVTQHQLDQEYQLLVANMRNFLQELSRWLEHAETLLPDVRSLKDEFEQDVYQTTEEKVETIFKEFNDVALSINEELVPVHKAYARAQLHPVLLCSPFMHRTFTKPLGYAGDYEMVNMILDNRGRGNNTYAKLVDSYSLRTPTAEAHRNRIDVLVDYFKGLKKKEDGKPIRILNIGCGPAREVQRILKEKLALPKIELHLLDFNEETLSYTKEKLEALCVNNSSVSVSYHHMSIHSILKRGDKDKEVFGSQYDLIYCAGLFDYLSNQVCRRMLTIAVEHINKDGMVIATNVSKSNPVRGFMEFLQDWHLVLRDEKDMWDITPYGCTPKIFSEKTGFNLFLELTK